MKIVTVTITGADDNDKATELVGFSRLYPFVEWGILFSRGKVGQLRYPSQEKIEEFVAAGLPLSAHFCGWYSREVMENSNFSLLEDLNGFSRVQINYNFSHSEKWNFPRLLQWIQQNPRLSVIFQANKANREFINMICQLDLPKNIHLLYDSSGGSGSVIKEIKSPFKNFTGYSGGISPGNIGTIVEAITTNPAPDRVWMDMESGVRINNRLSFKSVQAVLSACSPHIEITSQPT